MSEFKDRLKAERLAQGLSQDALAKMVDKDKGQSFISNFETGARSATSYIVELAHALHVDSYWLKTGKGARAASFRKLSEDEEMILAAFSVMDPVLREEWIASAKRQLGKQIDPRTRLLSTPPGVETSAFIKKKQDA